MHSRTAAEVSVSAEPVDYVYANGPRRYGARGNGKDDDSGAWNTAGKVDGFHFVPDGIYMLRSKVQTSGYVTMTGATRQSSWLVSGFSDSDYVFEVGTKPAGPNPNVGALERLRFSGAKGNNGCVHLQSGSHMWRLSDLLFSGPCPALVIDNCWDSNYTSLDILSAGVAGSKDPSTSASVIVRGGSNNLYFRGLRIEAPVSGGLYVDGAAAIRIVQGKIDNGFAPMQGAASITVTDSGQLYLEEFYIGGQYTYQVHVAGTLICDTVTFDGGSGQRASIFDSRSWTHLGPASNPGMARPNFRPSIGRLDLGRSAFNRTHPSVNSITPAAVYSKIFPIRARKQAGVIANGAVGRNTVTIATDVDITHNDQYTGCYLVHNSTGARSTSRRKILACFVGGQMTVAGASPLALDSGWSIEYCGGHYTPILAQDITLQSGATLFAQLFVATIVGTPTYDGVPGHPTFGMTKCTVSLEPSSAPEDVTGVYLISEETGEPFLIGYGIDAHMCIGVMYDRTAVLRNGDRLTVQAGYSAGIRKNGETFEWTYAGSNRSCRIVAAAEEGFDLDHLPLWGVEGGLGLKADAERPCGEPVELAFLPSIAPNGLNGHHFVIAADTPESFTINIPSNLQPGDRILYTIKNTSNGALGQITWSNFKMSPWASPGPGSQRTVEFKDIRGVLVEISRTVADVPN